MSDDDDAADDLDKQLREFPATCVTCGFDSNCRDCWDRDESIVCHSCLAEGRND